MQMKKDPENHSPTSMRQEKHLAFPKDGPSISDLEEIKSFSILVYLAYFRSVCAHFTVKKLMKFKRLQ